jgi:hypothetical protein
MELVRSQGIRVCLFVLLLISSFSSTFAYSSGPPTSSEGCAEGWGYHIDDPDPICEPLDKIGDDPPQNKGFCAALGCPYNPPNLPADGDSSLSADLQDKDQNVEELKKESNSSISSGEEK